MLLVSPATSRRSFWSGKSGVRSSDRVDAQQCWILLAAARRPAGTAHVVALAQGEAPDLAERHVDVLAAGQITAGAQEAVPLVAKIEKAVDRDRLALELRLTVALLLGLAIAPVTVAPASTPAAPVAGLGHTAAVCLVAASALTLLVLLGLLACVGLALRVGVGLRERLLLGPRLGRVSGRFLCFCPRLLAR
jgi:hypothetical protein